MATGSYIPTRAIFCVIVWCCAVSMGACFPRSGCWGSAFCIEAVKVPYAEVQIWVGSKIISQISWTLVDSPYFEWTNENLWHSRFLLNLRNCFQGMKYHNNLVLSQNILNQLTRSIEENVRNVVDNIANSHYVIVMNALSILWSGMETIPWCVYQQISVKMFSRKWKMQKCQVLFYKTHLRIWGKVEIWSTSYDAEWAWKGILYNRKGEKIIFSFDSRNSKSLSTWFRFF